MIEPNRERGSFDELSRELLSAAFPDASINWVAEQASTAAERVHVALGTTPLAPLARTTPSARQNQAVEACASTSSVNSSEGFSSCESYGVGR